MVQYRGGVPVTGGEGGAVPDAAALWPPYALEFLRFEERTLDLLAAAPRLVVPSSANRVYLAVSIGTTTSVVRAATRAPTLLTITGRLVTTGGPLIVTWSTDGPAVNEPWYMIGSINFTVMIQQAWYSPPLEAAEIIEVADGYDCSV